ncbi:MAG TPA: Mu-like prophage major head subunit gpT family protein [Methylococcus sp.]|nr:Mu-like prophage major head subunit gpT family protein [Methylococcus sp.]
MQITPSTLKSLSDGFNAAFLRGIESVQQQWPMVAMEVPSASRLENYGWMKDLPGMREWIGQRVVHNLESVAYQIVNKHWEHTIGVDRNDIEDDNLGLYSLRFSQQGEIAARHPDQLVWSMLLSGFTSLAMDGQYFFDTDHVGYNVDGTETTWSNYQSGAGNPWFLMDLSRSFMKPMVFQRRTQVQFIRKDRPEDDNVFMERTFLYGADARYNAGFGFYQLAYASKATLDATNYAAARAALQLQRRPDGSALDVRPTHLVVGPSNEAAARKLLLAEQDASGATNVWRGSAEILLVPALG